MIPRAEESGCDAFLTRPGTPADLVAEIERVMSGEAKVDRRESKRT
ncbi:MAG TPA: hypothetical protein VFT45_05040 [Longimicrobium sp.]|nr:hypothetical protein [Longimicrobium sp.]